jgi:hypothetical protein
VLPSAQAQLLNSGDNEQLELKVVAETGSPSSFEATKDLGRTVPKLVNYKGKNRYGAGRDEEVGGDDWVKPSVRTVAAHFLTNNWGDFSNMNGGPFLPHGSHQTGNDIDGKFVGYAARDADTAEAIIAQLNDDTYGSRIQKVLVTFNAPKTPPLHCEPPIDGPDTNHAAFWRAIQGVTLDDGRAATDVILPAKDHCVHFHWHISDF